MFGKKCEVVIVSNQNWPTEKIAAQTFPDQFAARVAQIRDASAAIANEEDSHARSPEPAGVAKEE